MGLFLDRLRFGVLGCMALALGACGGGERPTLLPLSRQEVRANETLTVSLVVDNPGGRAVRYRVAAPMLAGFETSSAISGSPSGGEFRWTPLAGHVGVHELAFSVTSTSGEVFDTQTMVVEVQPSADAAPVFLRPGAGGTFDLARDPCVRFDIEIRDDDSPVVDLLERSAFPAGAALISAGPKSATFEWCPTGDQIAASERWTLELQANDGDHPPVPHDFVAVLRTGGSAGCPGAAPSLTLRSPLEGERVTSSSGYDVRLEARDDAGLRDAPLLYWSTEPPADLGAPDLTTFAQVVFDAEPDGSFRARIPSLGLAEGSSTQVFYVASATDNDDATGTACDHRTDTPVTSFEAVGGAGTGGTLEPCASCTRSSECASGICAASAGGARCLTSCASGTPCASGTCGDRATLEGATARACGDAGTVCGGGTAMCTADSLEPNDAIATATRTTSTSYPSLSVCSGDLDTFRIDGAFRDLVTVRVSGIRAGEGDLDLRLLSSSGTILATSAGVTDTETASYCLGDIGRVYAQVYGYRTAQGPYDLSITRMPMACCSDDTLEPDDTRAAARRLTGTAFEGTVCPGDDDFIAVTVGAASTIHVELLFDAAIGDIDLELQGPTGARIASSTGTGDEEIIDAPVTAGGTYFVRVYGYSMAANTYLGDVIVTPLSTCATTAACAPGLMCEAGVCVPNTCSVVSDCPAAHLCPGYGPGGAQRHCGQRCIDNTECRSTEGCKWFPEGRACGLRGAGANGASCRSADACGAQRACLPWAGGYCARAGCRSNADCETGTYCAGVSGSNTCVLECESDAARCRTAEGYTCGSVRDLGGALHLACVPR